MKMYFKRALSIVLTLAMVCALAVVPASAAGADVTYTFGEWTKTADGYDLEIKVTLADPTSRIGAMQANVTFNKDVLEFTGAESGEAATGALGLKKIQAAAITKANTDGVFNLVYADTDGENHDVTNNGVIAKASFKVKADVESCNVDFGFSKAVAQRYDGATEHDYTAEGTAKSLAVKGADPTLDTVTLSASTATANGTDKVELTATATSTSSKDITAFVDWTVESTVTDGGVSVAADGKITVDAKAKAGTYTIKATPKAGESKGEAKTATLTVSRETSAITTVEMAADNATTALIPPKAEDPANTYTYKATVLDQYGDAMTTETVAWSVSAGETGVTMAADTGVLTVPATAKSGDVTITAAAGTKSDTLTVKVTNISFTGVDEGIKATDGVYGDKLSDMVKIDDTKITATAGSAVAGKYTLVDAETVPAAADAVAYKVLFTSNDETYKDIVVAEGTVKVAKKVVTVTANDIDVKVGAEQEEIDEQKGYTNTVLVGDDELSGTAAYKFYVKNDDGTKGAEVTTISTEEPAEYVIEVSGLTASANYDVKFEEGTLAVSKKSSLRPPIGQGTNPDGTEKDPSKDPVVDNKLAFDDVKEGDWFYDAVSYVVEKKLMNGTAEKTFEPNTNMSRAMVATVLYRLDGENKTDVAAAFEDIENDTWYTEGVAWAAEKGVVNGVSETEFAPNANVTREQLAAMLYRYAGSPEVDAEMGMAGFNDVDAISEWAATAMRWAVQNGILNGKDGGMLDPTGNATRAEVSAMIQRFVDKK